MKVVTGCSEDSSETESAMKKAPQAALQAHGLEEVVFAPQTLEATASEKAILARSVPNLAHRLSHKPAEASRSHRCLTSARLRQTYEMPRGSEPRSTARAARASKRCWGNFSLQDHPRSAARQASNPRKV
eukprot:CAMPEP_0170633438 /NCGR_PEP_ID=MMETSP0224-20130122/35985_1 /TAXON_ID=285029 /ORGANISM="Togula jolla, Strain CCCM 725" /LENGTH=129 /DNA_ID=CAMNT_0010962465 /DNA_START=222 /DNA_END=612 /DNA_ORIENTATION=+